jgi:Tannase and feruloyl esterase
MLMLSPQNKHSVRGNTMTGSERLTLLATAIAALMLCPSARAQRRSCHSLADLKLADVTIVSAKTVPSGRLAVPADGPDGPPQSFEVRAFCRVRGTIQPAAGSNIRFEVWMPSANWNGRFEGAGNGGFAGAINYRVLAIALRAGFASASTDTGHEASGIEASWAVGHTERIVDFGYRAIHLTAVAGKAIVSAFYRSSPKHSYFGACSNGGRQALMEAQRFPQDYDGIIAGAPANYWTHLMVEAMWDIQATLNDPASFIPAAKLPAIQSAVLVACDAQDGVKDGIITDPRACNFRPEALLCKGSDTNACLTAQQVTALKKLYAGPTRPNGERLFPGHLPGGELGPNGWAGWITPAKPKDNDGFRFGTRFFADMVFDDPAWDYGKFSLASGIQLADEKMGPILNATSPDLTAFYARGGKLILYHGWSDAAISPLNTLNYYNGIVDKMDRQKTETFVRLYMVPGMQHCGGGPGPDSFGALPAPNADPGHSMFSTLEEWVERGVAPNAIIATKYAQPPGAARVAEMTRPLCPYPEAPVYKGEGDIHDAASFVCKLKQ